MPYVNEPDEPDESNDTDDNRRSFLQKAGLLGVTGTLASIAGCSGSEKPQTDAESPSESQVEDADGAEEDAQQGQKVPQLTVTGYPPSNKNIHGTLTLITERVNELGFDVQYQGMNRERQLSKVYFEQDYDISSLGYTGRPHRLDPHMLLYKNYHSSQTDQGNYNWTNFQNEEIDNLLDEQSRLFNRDERQQVVKEVQAKIMEMPAGEMPIQHDQLVNVTNTADFEGFVEVAGLGLKNIWTWTGVEPTGDKTTLTAAFPMEIPHITPLQANESNLITQRMTHDRLMRINPEGLPEPWLAKEVQVSDDNTQLTIPLKEGFTFHDGEPVTADDVKFTFDFLKQYENPFFSSAVQPISEVTKDNDYQVTITLGEAFAPVEMLTLSRVHMLPQHIWQDIPDSVGVEKPFQWSPTESDTGLVGSGPFQFVEWRKGEGILLEANNDHPVAAPNVEEVFLRSVPNPSAMLTGAKNRDIDFVIRASAIQTDALEQVINGNDHLQMTRTNSVGYDEWSMNTTQTPLDDPAVRGAMSAVIPKNIIAKEIWNDYAIPAHSPTSPVLEFWHNENVKKWPEEGMEGARQLLQDAGYTINNDGIYMPSE